MTTAIWLELLSSIATNLFSKACFCSGVNTPATSVTRVGGLGFAIIFWAKLLFAKKIACKNKNVVKTENSHSVGPRWNWCPHLKTRHWRYCLPTYKYHQPFIDIQHCTIYLENSSGYTAAQKGSQRWLCKLPTDKLLEYNIQSSWNRCKGANLKLLWRA